MEKIVTKTRVNSLYMFARKRIAKRQVLILLMRLRLEVFV